MRQSVIVITGGDLFRLGWVLAGLVALERPEHAWDIHVVGDVAQEGIEPLSELVKRWQDGGELGGVPLELHLLAAKPEGSAARTSEARNLGIGKATGDQLLFLDGDCVPDRNWLLVHGEHMDTANYGWRRHLPETLVGTFSLARPLESYLPYCNSDMRFPWGEQAFPQAWFTCNASAPRAALVALGGFDAANYDQGWGGEDIELGYRLCRLGVEFVSLADRAMVMHLDHPKRETHPRYQELLAKAQRGGVEEVEADPEAEADPKAEESSHE